MDWTDKDDKDAAAENVVVHITAYVIVQRHTSVLSRRSYNSLNVTTCVDPTDMMLMLVGLPQSQVNAVTLLRHHRLAITLD